MGGHFITVNKKVGNKLGLDIMAKHVGVSLEVLKTIIEKSRENKDIHVFYPLKNGGSAFLGPMGEEYGRLFIVDEHHFNETKEKALAVKIASWWLQILYNPRHRVGKAFALRKAAEDGVVFDNTVEN